MPYGVLARQAVQRFASRADLAAAACTLEEREEYEPHLDAGNVVFAGVDYARILELASREADCLIWDGGNNDFPFLVPDLHVVLVDALRPGHETTHHPGETVLRMADVVVVAKTDAAEESAVRELVQSVRDLRPGVEVVRGRSPIRLDDPEAVRGRRVLVVDDGPTLTHGGMPWGAGYLAARAAGAREIVDPRDSAAPAIRAVFDAYPHLGPVLPALGYGAEQLEALRATIETSAAELVVAASPIDLAADLRLTKPVVRARYEYEDAEEPGLGGVVDRFLDRLAGR
jgi:predicted GTPase